MGAFMVAIMSGNSCIISGTYLSMGVMSSNPNTKYFCANGEFGVRTDTDKKYVNSYPNMMTTPE